MSREKNGKGRMDIEGTTYDQYFVESALLRNPDATVEDITRDIINSHGQFLPQGTISQILKDLRDGGNAQQTTDGQKGRGHAAKHSLTDQGYENLRGIKERLGKLAELVPDDLLEGH